MARKKDIADKKRSSEEKQLSMFDRAAKTIFSVLDKGYNDKEVLDSKDQHFRDVLNRELELSNGVAGGSIVDFVSSLKTKNGPFNQNNGMNKGQNNQPNSNDLFTKNINDIFGYFQDLYKNKFVEMDDLKFISKFIPALGEAVKTTLDSVVGSDSIAETINRTINLPASVSDENRNAITSEIEREEKNLNLLKKIRNIVYKKGLVTGVHYVYAVSYSRIFEEYDAIKKKEEQILPKNMKAQFASSITTKHKKVANESISYTKGAIDYAPALENIQSIFLESKMDDGSKLPKNRITEKMSSFYDSLPEITFEQSNVYTDALESVNTLFQCEGAFEAFQKKQKRKESEEKGNIDPREPLTLKIPDGTKDIKDKDVKPSKFEISGTYIKYIDAKKLIPLKVFDQVIGYYLIHPKNRKNSSREVTGITSIGNTLFSAVNIGEEKKHDAIQRIVDTISEGICNSFDNKFVTKNAEYKKLIADCVIANGLIDKDYSIQFIPESDIIPFVVQETEDGFGESILSDSLFPAKALLSMIVCRLLNYINKTGNKTIGHVHRSNLDPLDNNRLNRVIRDLQDQDITFNDLLSPNLVFNKFNRDGNYIMPTSKNGDHLIEFETQEGQNLDMTPDFEKTLEDMAILGTGVPTVLMEYINSADFSKQIVSAHIKYAGRIAGLQSDLEPPTTELYKRICENSNLSDEQKLICQQSLTIGLPRPKVLKNSNNADYMDTVVRNAESIADLMIGRDSATNPDTLPDGTVMKEKLMLRIAKEDADFIEWDQIEEMLRDVKIEIAEEKAKKENEISSNNLDNNMMENDNSEM